jgi:hypothetical protein
MWVDGTFAEKFDNLFCDVYMEGSTNKTTTSFGNLRPVPLNFSLEEIVDEEKTIEEN